jgi:hypothetical protein
MPWVPVLGLEMLLVAVVDQRVEAIDAADDDIAATPAIAAVRATELDELLPQERHRAGSAIAGAHEDLGLVEEFHLVLSRVACRWAIQAACVS